MIIYDCKVRLAGNVNNEVFKSDVTAAEVMLLREIHGPDAVVNIVEVRDDKRSHDEERERLTNTYVSPRDNTADRLKEKMAMFRNLFGHDTVPLPTKLPDSQVAGIAPEKPKRTKVEKPVEEAFE